MPPKRIKCGWRGCAYIGSVATIAGDFCPKHAELVAAGPVTATPEDVIEVLTEAVIGVPQVNQFLKRLAKPLDRAGQILDRLVPYVDRATQRGPIPTPPPGKPPHRTHSRPKPPSDPEPKLDDPRTVLGFAPDTKLTEKIVRDRRKELARIFHSDAKGNDETMKKVNIAADALLKEIKENAK